MKIVVYPSDRQGCGSYRLIWPAEVLASAGYDVKVAKRNPAVVSSGNKIVGLAEDINADAVVFQRPCRRQYLDVFNVLQKSGIKIIIDNDDNLTDIHRNNYAFGTYNYQNLPDMHWKFGLEACQMADTVTTPKLQEVYGGVVVPNCIPQRYLDIERKENELVTVGWAGHVATHPEDLQVTHGAVNQALSATKGLSRFLALGDQKTLQNLGVRERVPNGWLPGVPLDQYPGWVSQLDIGIVPLADTPFNQAKSWLKALEYSSLGVVPIGSPTPDNIRLQEETGVGFIARNPKEWSQNIEALIKDPEKRQELSVKAREFASQWTIEGNTNRWATAWGLDML